MLASEARYRRLFEAAKDGILILDAQTGVVEDLNPVLASLLRYSQQDLVGKRFWEIGAFKDIAASETSFEQLRKKEYLRNETRLPDTEEGHPVWVEFVSNIYTVNDKQVIQCNIRDITARKLAEERLVNSEAQYKDLVENISDLICTHDLDGNILSMNASAEKMLGLEFNPSRQLNIKDVLAPQFRKDFERYVEGIRRNGRMQGVMRVQTRLGELRLWEFNNSLNTSGKLPVVRGFARDITEQKKAEVALKAAKARFQAMAENIASIIWLVDENLQVVYRSPSSERVSGWSTEELNARGILSFAHPADKGKAKSKAAEIFNKPGVLLPVSIRAIHKDGHYMLLEGTAINLLHDKHIKAVVVNVHDNTERNKTEQQLTESENRLRTIVQNEPECVKILNKKGEVLSMNPAGLAMVEADAEKQVLGYPMLNLVNPRFRAAFGELSSKVFRGESGRLEFEITGFKGTRRWLETLAVPLRDSKGEIISILGVTRDVSERKKAEQEIRKTTDDLRQLAAHLQSIREEERKRIGREIHDELGQQLTAVKMDIAWIDKKIPAHTPLLKNKLKNVIRLLDESNQSIRRILSELRPSIPGDRDLLQSFEWLSRQLTANTGIPVHLTTDQSEINLPEPVSTCLFRVCQEAFTNITRYAGASHVGTSLRMRDNWISLTIEDDGKGFDPEAVQNNKSFGILGMKERVLSLGGKFELFSSPGAGTRIVASLPLMHPLLNPEA